MITMREGFEEGKIFVGGLSQETTRDSMRRHFAEFGNITDCVVMVDNATGRSRGFGFVSYDNTEAIDAVLACKQVLDGKEVDCKRACPRETMNQSSRDARGNQAGGTVFNTDKIFVGGLPDISTEEFKTYFEKYGHVIDAVLMTDKNNNRPRGFGFVTFENPEVVEDVVRHYGSHQLRGKWVEVKKATPKDQMSRGGRSVAAGGMYGAAGYQKWNYNGYGMDRRGPAPNMYAMYGPGGSYYDAFAADGYVADTGQRRADYGFPPYAAARPSPTGEAYAQQPVPSYGAGVAAGYGVAAAARPYAAGYGSYDNIPANNGAYNNFNSNGQYAAAVYATHGPQRGNRSGVFGRSFPY